MLDSILRGHYKIISHLGGGGFGQTYLAEDIDLPTHPTCVVKQLKPISREPFVLETAKRLFDNEAEMLYSLGSHDRIPRLLAHFQEGEEFYLVQEFADGTDLTKEIGNDKRLPEFAVISLLQEILEILVFVHERGIVHRDIKPANLIRRNSDRKIVLIDFGAVKEINGLAGDSQGNTNLTIAIGSPGYMPIEQVNGKPRLSSDIYAVGMIGIQAVTGAESRLFGEHPETAELIWRDRVQGNYSPQFLDILDKMVRYDFRQRYQTAQEVLKAISSLPSINEHNLPTLISSHPDVSNSPTIVTKSQSLRQSTDVPINDRESPTISRLNQSNVDHLQQKKSKPWKKLAIIAGIVAAISAIVAIVKLTHTPPKTEVPNAVATSPSNPSTVNSAKPSEVPNESVIKSPLPTTSTPTPTPTPTPSNANSAEELLAQAILLNRNDKHHQALVKIDEALKLDPKNADAWAAQGFTLAKLDRDNEAIAAYDKALEIKPEFPFARQSRALLERKLKSKKK